MSSYSVHFRSASDPWSEPDLSVLDQRRAPVPSVPLALIPQPWRDWIGDVERATGAPADYALQSVLAGVASACGAAVRVRVTPAWDEPLVLWLAAVGEPSAGKSAALAPMRHLLEIVEQERQASGDAERHADHAERVAKGAETLPFVPFQIVADGIADPAVLAALVAANPRGLLQWRDGPSVRLDGVAGAAADPATWLAAWDARGVTVARPRQPAVSVRHFPVSLLAALRPQPLKASLQEMARESGDDSLAARFLFAWPGPQPYRALAVVEASRDEEILRRLRVLSRLGNGAVDPHVIEIDDRGRAALDTVLARLHAERETAEGPEATWLGLSRSLIVRLAGVLELMGSIDGTAVLRPGAIGAEQIEAAASLWRDYYWPHARAVFDSAELSEYAKRVRRVARWLMTHKPTEISREEVRRRALSQGVTADDTQHVLERLSYLGFVRADLSRERPGRRTTHWLVNPALGESENAAAQLA